MGAVYRARHTKLDREVAVKLLSSDRLRSARAVSRFEREMKAIGRLHHPHIVQAFDAGEVEGQYYLVMELVSGLDLSAVVDRVGPLPLADACEIVRQVALGLQHAHEHDLVHRDIKPSNLMLTPAGDVKLLDLGRARLQDPLSDEHAVTSSGQIMGTLDYMAPEQLGDSHAVDKAAIRCHRN
jgi:serine/threonine protein kinase